MLESLFTGNNAKKSDNSEENLLKLMTYNSSFNSGTFDRLLRMLQLPQNIQVNAPTQVEAVPAKLRLKQPVSSKGTEENASKRLEQKRKSHPMNLNNQSMMDQAKSRQPRIAYPRPYQVLRWSIARRSSS